MTTRVPVAITGLGCLCAAGVGVDDCLDSLYRGERRPTAPTLFSTSHPVTYPVLEIPETDFPREEGPLLRTSELGLAAAREALADAGLDETSREKVRIGVILGTTVGSAMNNEAFYQRFRDGERPEMTAIDRFRRSNPAAVVARELGLNGPTQTLVNACSSGTDALGIGAGWLRSGLCDVVLAGGADELCRTTYNGFSALMITNENPCSPFDRDRQGLNLGEGAGMLVLEKAEAAKKRGVRLRAQLLGYGAAADAYHLTAPSPDGKGLRRALCEAMEQAGIAASDLAFVNAHGTGTKDNDKVESQVLHDLLPGIPFHSTKGYTGHTLGAAGGIEAVFTVAFLERGEIPASIGFSSQDPDLPTAPVTENTPVAGKAAISESLAFGGNNAVAVFGRVEDTA